MASVDEEWQNYLCCQQNSNIFTSLSAPKVQFDFKKPSESKPKPPLEPKKIDILEELDVDNPICGDEEDVIPKCEELYISTKTKVLYLNQEIDIANVFWNIPMIDYWRPEEGVIKKQMKIVSKTEEEYNEYRKKLDNIYYYSEHIIKQINNPAARRMKFKDERKITIGISKKDIMNCRGKVKNAFYNCFAMIMRFKYENVFREIHVKVFNTGKMEIPGILNMDILDIVKSHVYKIIQPLLPKPIVFVDNKLDENVLINSNFNCGFYIDREKLHHILSRKYGIETSYDPCSYPGVKCKFYFNNELDFDPEVQNGKVSADDCVMTMTELDENKKYTDVSFMIFRTGSCLIVGNCSEKILLFIFQFIKKLLLDEYSDISVNTDINVVKNKKTKLRKRSVRMTQSYRDTIPTTM